MRRPLPVLVTLVAAAATIVASTSVQAEALTAHGKSTKKTTTNFAFVADGYGSQVVGGAVPAKSDQTAFNIIACTNKAGVTRENYTAKVTVPGLGVLHGVRTSMYTKKAGSTYTSYSTHSIARVTLAQSALGSLEILGLQSVSQASHTPSGFKAATETSVAKLVFTPTGGASQTLAIPAPGQPISIPGVATIAIGTAVKKVTAKSASASANVLTVRVAPTGTVVRIAQSRATIGNGVRSAVFKGYSAGLRAAAADDNARVGRTPLTPVSCQGTDGEEIVNHTASVDGGDVVQASGVYSGAVASNFTKSAKGTVAGTVAHASLAGGAIQVDGVIAKANVVRDGRTVVSDSKGTKVLSLTINGTAYDVDSVPTINVPGVAKIQTGVVEKLTNGIRVIGLRATLLDGSGAVVDLGVAQLQVLRGPTV